MTTLQLNNLLMLWTIASIEFGFPRVASSSLSEDFSSLRV
jgi:hypothetical protein